MRLSSSLEPNGPKTSGHYLILRHESQRDLVKLPKSYSDIQKQVERLYHLKPEHFYLETAELNLCAGERIRIPEDAWSDIAELLGNVYVEPRDIDSHPESGPESVSPSVLDKGVVDLRTPLVKDEFVAINIGNADFDADQSSASKLNVQLIDEKEEAALSVSIFPSTRTTILTTPTNDAMITRTLKEPCPATSSHNIIVSKQGSSFLVMFNSQHIGTIEAQTQSPLISVRYDLGAQSSFTGPVTTDVFSGHSQLSENFAPYHAMFPPIDKDSLFQQIVVVDPQNSTRVLKALSDIRREITFFKRSISGIKWRTQELHHNAWSPLEWNLDKESLFVVRYTITEGSSQKEIHIRLGKPDSFSLRVTISPDDKIAFSDHDARTKWCGGYHKADLAHSMQTPGEHLVAFVHYGGKTRVIFDFKQIVTVPKNTMAERRPENKNAEISPDSIVVADLYEFSA